LRVFTIGALICLLVMSSFQFAAAEWTGATADQFISYVPENDKIYCPALAVGPAPDYTLYAIWAQEPSILSGYEIYFSKSTDGGTTWTGTTADQRISAYDGDGVYNGGIYGARRTDIAVNSVGYIYVVWPEYYITANFDTTQEIMMVMSTDGGSTWIHSDTDFPVSDTNSIDGPSLESTNTPNIAIDSNDDIHVIWNQKYPLVSTGKAEIYYSRSTDNGTTWTGRAADNMISNNNGYSSFSSDIDVGPDNKIHCVWVEWIATADQRVEYGVSTNGGLTFSSETMDSVISYGSHSSSLYYPRVKAKPFVGHLHVIYCQNDTVTYVGTTNGGATWYENEVYGGSTYDMAGPDIAVTTTGTMVAIIDEEDPESWDWSSPNKQIFARYSFDYGQTWSAALQPVSNFDETAVFDRTYIPSVLITNTDVLHCLYSTNKNPASNSYQEMAYSRNDELGILPGSIEGTVTELDGITPIQDVEVTVLDDEETVVATDFTNAFGDYEFGFGLEPGFYTVEFKKYTHHDTSETNVEVPVNTIVTIDMSMRPKVQGLVSGTVYEETGTNPLADVIVVAVDQSAVEWGRDTSDVSGYYELILWADTYDISFTDESELFNDTTINDVAVPDGGSVDLDVNMNWAIPADDVGPVTINEPAGFMIIGQPYTPAVTVENFGYQDQTFDLNFIIQDASLVEVYNETYSGASVDSLGTVQVVFSVDYTPLVAGVYQITTTVINTGDENTGNNTMVTPITAYAHQSIGGPDDYGYSYRDNLAPCGPEFNWIDISASGTQLLPTSHYFMSGELPIGFSFEFYGVTYTSMWVNSHGALHIGVRDTWLMTNDCPIPDATTPVAPMLLPWWDGKEVQYEIGQGVYYQYFDEPTNDYTVIQWNASTYGRDDTTEFEVILYENGRILFQYNKVSPTITGGMGQLATVGLEYDAPPLLYGISYLCNDDNPGNRLFAGLAIEWVTDIGEPGSISGVVTDADTDLPIEGVYVEVNDAGVHDFTNSLGEYSLPGLYACDYSISFSHVDYPDTTVTGVTVVANANTTLNVEMRQPLLCYPYLPGDANMYFYTWPPAYLSGDVTYLVNFFRGLPSSVPCKMYNPLAPSPDPGQCFWASADVNGSCTLIGADVTKLVNVFRGITTPDYCPNYVPCWPTPADLPEEPQADWPNCEDPCPPTTVTGERVIDTPDLGGK